MTVTETWHFDQVAQPVRYFFVFCYFWASQFLVAAGQLIIALCFSMWYFSRDKAHAGHGVVARALFIAGRYHLGTVAFGSLIIAVIKLFRYFVGQLQRRAKKSPFARLAQCLLCCLQCCLWCVEKCMKFINTNAYVYCAIHGTSFCASARAAFFLIVRNIWRIAVVSVLSSVVCDVGKVFISVLTTAAAYVFMDRAIGDRLNSPVGPLIFVFVFAYFIAMMFMSIFAMGITTLIQCFIADEEMHPDVTERYATPDLAIFFAKTASAPPKREGESKDVGTDPDQL